MEHQSGNIVSKKANIEAGPYVIMATPSQPFKTETIGTIEVAAGFDFAIMLQDSSKENSQSYIQVKSDEIEEFKG